MKKILIFRTAQFHICEKIFSFIKIKYADAKVDFLSNQDFDSDHISFVKKYILDYSGFLTVQKIPADIREEIKNENYDLMIFPYSMWGIEDLGNLLAVGKHLKPKKILFINELGDGKECSVFQLSFFRMVHFVVNYILLAPFFLIALWTYLINLMRKKEKGFQPRKDIHVIRGTTNIRVIQEEPPRSRSVVKIACIARFDPIKGHSYLIKGFYQLISEGWTNIELNLIGDGPEASSLKKLVKDLNIEDRVVFAGFQTNVIPYLKECDIFVLPSLNEAMPITLLEIMAAGKPVIATKVGDIPNIIADRENGMLVNPGSEQDIYVALKGLIENPDLRRKIGLQAYYTFQNELSLDQFGKKYYALYQKVTNDTKVKKVWELTVFDQTIGGVTNYISLIQPALIPFGVDVESIPLSFNMTVRSFFLKKLPAIFDMLFPKGKEIFYYAARKFFLCYIFLKKYCEGKPDLVHVHDVLAYNALRSLCRIFSLPLILTKHGDLAKEVIVHNKVDKNSLLYRYFSRQEMIAYTNAEFLVVVDEESKKRIEIGKIAG